MDIPGAYQNEITSLKNKTTQKSESPSHPRTGKKKTTEVYQTQTHKYTERVNIKERSDVTTLLPHIDKLRIQLQTLAIHRVGLQY